MSRIMNSGRKCTGIIFGDDSTAIGGMKYLQKYGYSVPEDVAVIGYHNTSMALCSTPALSSIDYNVEMLGKLVVTMLDAVLNGEPVKHDIMITPKLVVREST